MILIFKIRGSGKMVRYSSSKGNIPKSPLRGAHKGISQLDQALEKFKAGRLNESWSLCKKYLHLCPNDAAGLHLLGLIHFKNGCVDEGIEALRKAISYKQNEPAIYNNLGSFLQAVGNLTESLQSYSKALQIKPDYPEALSNYGHLLGQMGRKKDALTLLSRAIELSPAYPEAHNNIGNILKNLGRLAEAEYHFKRAIDLNPNYPDPYNNYGVLLVAKGELEQASRLFEKALSLNRSYLEAYNNLGTVLLELDGVENAKNLLEKALQLKPGHAETLNNLGSAHYLMGEFEKAIELYERSIQRRVRYVDPIANLSRVYIDLGRNEEAWNILKSSIGSDQGKTLCEEILATDRDGNTRTLDIGVNALIVSWLQGDFERSARLADNLKALRSIKANRNNKNTLVFLSYLVALLEFRSNNLKHYSSAESHATAPLVVIGESHALSPCHVTSSWRGERRATHSLFLMGLKMWHLAKPGISHHRVALETQLLNLPPHAHLLMTIGEIDCRTDEGIWFTHNKKGIPLPQLVRETTEGYLDWLERVLLPRAPASIVVQGIPAPVDTFAHLGNEEKSHYLDMIRSVNTNLRHGAHSRGWGFLDVFAATASETGFSHRRWHLDNNHLRPDFYSQAEQWIVLPPSRDSENSKPAGNDRAATASPLPCGKDEVSNNLSASAYNRGNAHLRAGQLQEALSAYDAAIQLDPSNLNAVFNRALVFYDLGKTAEALTALQQVIATKPDYAEAHLVLGHAALDAGYPLQAQRAFQQANELRPNAAESQFNLAKVLLETGNPEDAMRASLTAYGLAPGNILYWSSLMLARQYCPDENFDPKTLGPWAMQQEVMQSGVPTRLPIRIGFVSGDLCRHPVGLLLLPLLQKLNPAHVRAHCYSTGTKSDDVSQRIQQCCQWNEVRALSPNDLRQRIVDDRIDILLDLSGYTRDHRLAVFAQRAAPIQVAWLGYSDTSAVPAMDYVLMDEWHVLPEMESRYTEKVLRLPNSRFLFAPPEFSPPVTPPPFLQKNHITFGCFNNTAKLNAAVIAVWAKVLIAVPESRLVLKWRTLGDAEFCDEIRARFLSHGVTADRLGLRMWSSPAELLAEYADIDIALDPFPFCGGYTSFEALWMGVPVITLPTVRPISRQGLCLLSNIGLSDLVASDEAEYVSLASKLANDSNRLASLRGSLRHRLECSALMDSATFAKNFEQMIIDLACFTQTTTEEMMTDGNSTPNSNSQLTFLHVGCGPKRKNQTTRGFDTPEWRELRLDIDEGVQPDIVGTMLDMSAVENESVDAIFSSHNIEHLYPHEVSLALKEFLRVLKPTGFLVVTCPDLQSVCQLIAEDKLTDAAYTAPAGPIAPIDILYGHRPQLAQGNHYMAHKCGFTESVLRGELHSAGFVSIATMRRGHTPYFDLYAVATKNECSEDRLRQLAMAHLPVG